MNVRGNLPLMILYVLSKGANHGYNIAQTIEKDSDRYFEVKAGTLYPALHSLEEQGYIASRREIENGRELRYYTLTPLGETKLSEFSKAWDDHVSAVNRVLKGRPS